MRSKLIILVRADQGSHGVGVPDGGWPQRVKGVDTVEIWVAKGPTTPTVQFSADRTLELRSQRGSAHVLQSALIEAGRHGADYLLTLDRADEFDADNLTSLLTPLMARRADVAVGNSHAGGGVLDKASGSPRSLVPWGRASSGNRDRVGAGVNAYNRRAMLRLGGTSRLKLGTNCVMVARQAGLNTADVPLHSVGRGIDIKAIALNVWTSTSRAAGESLTYAMKYRSSRTLIMVGGLGMSAGGGLALAAVLGAVRSGGPALTILIAGAGLVAASMITGMVRYSRRALHDTVARLSAERLSESQAF